MSRNQITQLQVWLTSALLAVTDRAARTSKGHDEDRGDVPGWVMITMMTAIVVIALLAAFRTQVLAAVQNAFDSVSGAGKPLTRHQQTCERDTGSSVAEFTMVLVLLLLLFLALLSIGFWAYSRTLLTSAAADTARYIANADIDPAAAPRRVAELLDGSIAAGTSDTLTCTSGTQGLLVQVSCRMRTPGIVSLLDGLMPDVTATGHSVREGTG